MFSFLLIIIGRSVDKYLMSAILFLFIMFSVYAQEAPVTRNIDEKELISIFNNEGINSVENFLEYLNKSKDDKIQNYFNNYVLIAESGSLQKASLDEPRVILSSNDAKTIFTFNGGKDKEGGSSIEVILYDDKNQKFNFYDANFETKKIEKNPKKCIKCHTEDLRPNWDSYPFWHNMIGAKSNDTTIVYHEGENGGNYEDQDSFKKHIDSVEYQKYQQFMKNKKNHSRYQYLNDFKVSKSYQNMIMPNERFNHAVQELNSKRILRKMTSNTNKIAKFKYAILGNFLCGSDEIRNILYNDDNKGEKENLESRLEKTLKESVLSYIPKESQDEAERLFSKSLKEDYRSRRESLETRNKKFKKLMGRTGLSSDRVDFDLVENSDSSIAKFFIELGGLSFDDFTMNTDRTSSLKNGQNYYSGYNFVNSLALELLGEESEFFSKEIFPYSKNPDYDSNPYVDEYQINEKRTKSCNWLKKKSKESLREVKAEDVFCNNKTLLLSKEVERDLNETQVKKILNYQLKNVKKTFEKCISCHRPGNYAPAIPFGNLTELSKNKEILKKIKEKINSNQMPPSSPLKAIEKSYINEFLDQM